LARSAVKLLSNAKRIPDESKPETQWVVVTENHWAGRLMEFVHSLALAGRHGSLLHTEQSDSLYGRKLTPGITASELRAFEAVALALEMVADECTTPDARSETPKQRPVRRAGGRPSDTDPREDQRIAEAWRTRQYATYEALASAIGKTKRDVKLAIDRHRKHAGKTRPGKPGQAS
jgi:hypothetical protein